MKQILFILSTIVFISLIGCKGKVPAKQEAKKFALSDSAKKIIAIDSVQSCSIEDELQLSGEVDFDENRVNKVFPRNSGQVIESKVSLGDKVRAGQVLAVIRSADIAGNYADLSSANADIAIAERQLNNTRTLYKNGIASEKDLTEANQNYEKALSVKRKIESLININGGNHTSAAGTYTLTAPFNGYIVEKKVNAGNFIRSDMGDYLFTISDLKDVWVMANVFEDDISKVKEGFEVKVITFAYPNKIFKGKIDKISEVIDPSNKVLHVRVRLSNDGMLLKPQMFAKVIVTNEENKRAICVPTKSLINQNGKSYVVVYKGDDDMRIAEVDVIKTVGDKTFLNSGVVAGDKLIVRNQLLIFQQLLNE